MKDPIARIRKKARLIVEVRFEIIPQLLDCRGEIISTVHPELKDVFEFWTSNPNRTVFLDRQDNPRAEFSVTPTKLAVILEDGSQVPEFLDRSAKYFRIAHPLFSGLLTEAARIGVRFIEILEPSGSPSFEEIHELILDRLHRVPDLGLDIHDSFVKLVHEYGFFQVGPVREDEEWIKQHFKNPDVDVPNAGIGFDIDSRQLELEALTLEALLEAVEKVCQLTKAVEEGLVDHLGLLNV